MHKFREQRAGFLVRIIVLAANRAHECQIRDRLGPHMRSSYKYVTLCIHIFVC